MSLVHKAKRVIRSHYSAVLSRKLSLADGTYMTRCPVAHITERCGWKQFGASDEATYERWWQEACGIVSLRTITTALAPNSQSLNMTIYKHINRAVKSGAYLENVGWKHNGLVNLAKRDGLKGYTAQLSLNAICKAIVSDKLIIASVYRPFTRFIDEGAERKNRGGHLVVIRGFTWQNGKCTGLFVEDPYDLEQRKEPIDSQLFEDVYSGAAIVLYE